MRATIPVVTRTQDNGDGGYTTYAYNSERELLSDHPKLDERWNKSLTPDDRIRIGKEIIEEDDPYENGYIGHGTIEIDIEPVENCDDTPVVSLAQPLSFHAGQ